MRNAATIVSALGLFALVTLGGCGFHLQGSGPEAENIPPVRVSYEQPYRVGTPPLIKTLEDRLRARGALAEKDAVARIHVSQIRNQRRLLSVSGVDGRAAEFELITFATFSVSTEDRAGNEKQTLSVRRTYSFDNTERLAAEAEQDDLIDSMHRELAELILLRTDLMLQKTVATPAE